MKQKAREKENSSKISAELAVALNCDVAEHTSDACWLNKEGEHVPLLSEDLSRWALWVVSQMGPLLMCLLTYEVWDRPGDRLQKISCQSSLPSVGKKHERTSSGRRRMPARVAPKLLFRRTQHLQRNCHHPHPILSSNHALVSPLIPTLPTCHFHHQPHLPMVLSTTLNPLAT